MPTAPVPLPAAASPAGRAFLERLHELTDVSITDEAKLVALIDQLRDDRIQPDWVSVRIATSE